MQFILRHIAGLADMAALPGCEEATGDLVDAVLEEASRFATGVLSPLNRVGDREGCRLDNGHVITPTGWQDAYQQFRDGGWVGLALPTEYGGQGLPHLLATPVNEMWHSANLAFSLMSGLAAGETAAISAGGSEEIKAHYLPKIVSGTWAPTMNLTEPQAGSDVGAIRSRAEPQADGSYRVFGQKIFITYGDHEITENIVHLVLARIADAPEGVKGISLFLVPKFLVNSDGSLGARNDVRCIALEHKLGIHGSPTCVMSFGDAGGAVGYLLGQPNRGLEIMFLMMNEARFGVGLQGVAMAERAWQQANAYAHERVQGRDVVTGEAAVPIARHADVRRMLAGMRARIMAARMLAYTAAGWFDHAHRNPDTAIATKYRRYIDLLMPVVKAWSTESGREAIDLAVQVHGGMGFIEETGIAQHYRDARIMTIYEGTTGIQANDLLGRKILRENGETLRLLISDIEATAAEVDADVALADIAAGLRGGIDALRRAVLHVMADAARQSPDIHGVAVPLLMLLGNVCGSWQMARAALAAGHCRDPEFPADYLTEIVALSRFWFGHLAPQAQALMTIVTSGGAAVTAWQPPTT
jgi:acyl-CoA dehydrogenase